MADNNEDWLESFETNDIVPLEIAYEDFVADYTGTLGRVVEYLGAAPAIEVAGMRPELSKQADAMTEVWLDRYREQRDAIEPRPFPTNQPPALMRD